MATNLKRPELNLTGNISENFKNLEVRFNDYCVQANYRNLDKDPATAPDDHYKKPQLEIAALRSAMPDEALQVIRYTIEPQIAIDNRAKPWIWMEKLRLHYTGSTGSSFLADRFKFWALNQTLTESVQAWEVRIRQAGSLCSYETLSDEMYRDKFIFGLNNDAMRAELLKTHLKPDNTPKSMTDVVTEAKALESAYTANKLMADSSKSTIEERVHWVKHKEMKLRREPGTCHWCGDKRGPHLWRQCPARGKTCSKCGINDHFANVCLANGQPPQRRGGSNPPPTHYNRTPSQTTSNRGSGRRRVDVHHLQFSEDEPADPMVYADYYHEQCYSLETPQKKRKCFVKLPLSAIGSHFQPITLQIDTAASCNTLSHSTLTSLGRDIQMSKSPYLLHPYGNTRPLRPLGQVELLCHRNNHYDTLTFQILPDDIMANKPALLSGGNSERLGLVRIESDTVFSLSPSVTIANCNTAQDTQSQGHLECNHIEQLRNNRPSTCNPLPSPSQPIIIPAKRRLPTAGALQKEHILMEYAENFEGLGCLGPPVHFETKPDVTPVQMPIHRVPVAKRSAEKSALDKYEKAGIITKVDEPTPWCSNEVIRETPRKVRICIDPSQTVNKAILRPIYQMPTLNEQLHRLANAKCFSLVDVRDGFLHVPLDEESSHMTTMHTSYGRYRWRRLPFGISSGPEEFQMRLISALEGLEGIICIADDILVFGEGTDFTEAEKDHDRRFVALMERCLQKNIKLNPTKLQFKLTEVKFMGNIITANGMKADPDKVTAITAMPTPRNKAALLRFLGMANYLSPYCSNLSTVIRPLTALTQKDLPFSWTEVQERAFNDAKQLIAAAPILQYYDLGKPVVLQVDASEEGLGGALLQPNAEGKLQPVAFTSNSLSSTEQRYSQIEKECLAICNTFGKFDHWLFGKSDITVHTDHQPLETIYKKPLHKSPARLQRMLMRLQRYQFSLQYKKGTSLHIAETLSRAALPTPVQAKVTGFEVFRLELEHSDNDHNPRLTDITEELLRSETKKDQTLTDLQQSITSGWPDDKQHLAPHLRPFWTFREELSTQNGIVYKGQQVLVPQSMHSTMLGKIHANHFGAESNIRMAREVLFWPGMRKAISDMCDTCSVCAKYSRTLTKEPMKSLPLPTQPWQIVSQDIFTHEQKDYLVTVCHFSDWIEVDELQDTLSATVINKTKAHFARFGIPQICHSDNGPQFASKEYENFATQYGFKHTTSSPYHPQANGRAEAAVKVAKATLKKSADFQIALLNYRNTPPQGHTYSPAQRMFCRRTRTTLPTPNHLIKPSPVNLDIVTQELTLKRAASKRYYDSSPTKVHPEFAVGSSVYAKPSPTQRGHPWIRGTIIYQDTPRSYTIQTPNSNIRRNRVHIRPTIERSPPPTPANPPPLIQEPPPDNGNLSIGPQEEETVASNHPPVQTLPPQPTGTERLPNNGPENLATLASQDQPPAPTLGTQEQERGSSNLICG